MRLADRSYYNDNDPYCAAWLRNLVRAGLLPAGDIDDRDIRSVQPADLSGYTQCHFFAGIGGWPLALALAGWSEARPVWTASCPCQPLSVAGQRREHADERHLWPAVHRLIAECRPATLLGEQVAGAAGSEWLAGVRADLEELGYACGAAALPACAVGAPHRRERLWFVADADAPRLETRRRPSVSQRTDQGPARANGSSVGHAARLRRREGWTQPDLFSWRPAIVESGVWSDAEWITGADGKSRRVNPGLRLLAHGIPARVAKLRALGNAIVPPLAAEFIRAVMETLP